MTEVIQIKGKNKEEIKKRIKKVLGIAENQILKIDEKVKGFSFLGLFKKEGTYEVTYTTEEVKEEIVVKKEVTKIDERHKAVDLRKERAQKKETQKNSKFEYKKEVTSDNQEMKSIKNIELNEEKVQEIVTTAKKLIDKMGLSLEVSLLGIEGRNYVISLTGQDKGIIIGKKGKTLNSFEYLLNSLIKDARIDVDVEGFKEKRNETLIELANKMSLKAIKTRKVIKLNPMPPRERKIIHEIINQYPELDTYSEGRDPKRYIVIKVKR